MTQTSIRHNMKILLLTDRHSLSDDVVRRWTDLMQEALTAADSFAESTATNAAHPTTVQHDFSPQEATGTSKHHEDIFNHNEGTIVVACIVGAPSLSTLLQLRRLHRRQAPIVYVPCGCIDSKYSPLMAGLLKSADTAIVSGRIERLCLSRHAPGLNIHSLSNPVTSRHTTMEAYVSAFTGICRHTAEAHQRREQAAIAQRIEAAGCTNEAMARLAAALLHAHGLVHRQALSRPDLEHLAHLMTTADVDEAQFEHLLRRLHIHAFSASLFQVMADERLLSEGYMPLPPAAGRCCRHIHKIVRS